MWLVLELVFDQRTLRCRLKMLSELRAASSHGCVRGARVHTVLVWYPVPRLQKNPSSLRWVQSRFSASSPTNSALSKEAGVAPPSSLMGLPREQATVGSSLCFPERCQCRSSMLLQSIQAKRRCHGQVYVAGRAQHRLETHSDTLYPTPF